MRIRSYFQNNNKNGKSLEEFIEILKEAIVEDCYITKDKDINTGVIVLTIKPIKKIVDPEVYKKGEGFKQADIANRITAAINHSLVIHDYGSKEHVIKCTVAGKKVEVIVKPTVLRYVSTHTPNPTTSSEVAGNPTASTTGVDVSNPKKTAIVGKTVKSTWSATPDWKPKKKKEKPIDRKEKATEPAPVKPKVKKYKSRVAKVFLNDDERFPIFKLDSPSKETK